VHCVVPNELLPLSRKLIEEQFEQLAKEYDDLSAIRCTLPQMASMLLREPDEPEVILCDYTSGEVLTALAAESCHAATMSSSACIGEHYAMFEPLHSAMEEEAGQGTANPSGMIAAAIQMLEHLEMPESATLIHNAWLKTLEDGKHTKAIYNPPISVEQVTTEEFARAVIANFGKSPRNLEAVHYLRQEKLKRPKSKKAKPMEKDLLGVDLFIHFPSGAPDSIGEKADAMTAEGTKLRMIANRGLKVWPNPIRDMTYTDLWRCRFMAHNENNRLTPEHVLQLLHNAQKAKLDVVKTENLYTFNGELGYTFALGE
jgi:isocitrate dehydrogenase